MIKLQLIFLFAVGMVGVTAFPAFTGMDQIEKRGTFSHTNMFERGEPVADVEGLMKVPDADHPFIAP
ncbi:hypothetical protein FRB97_006603, partial [Tulasnella sp. 331]